MSVASKGSHVADVSAEAPGQEKGGEGGRAFLRVSKTRRSDGMIDLRQMLLITKRNDSMS